MKVSRRSMIAGGVVGALAVPTLAGLARWRWQHGSHTGLVHDASLTAGARFAAAGTAAGTDSVEVAGDRVRFARDLVASRPALIAGVTRQADAVMIADVAAEAGYVLAAELRGNMLGCTGNACDSAFVALTRVAVSASGLWADAFGAWAANPQASAAPTLALSAPPADSEIAMGWLLVPKA
jgi:hypothetical protein